MSRRNFTPPNQRARQLAIAASKAGGRDRKLKAFLNAAEESRLFEPIHQPSQGDWLATYSERGQPASAYTPPRSGKRKLYIQPLGAFEQGHSPSLDTLQEFASLYLCMEVEVLAPIGLVQSPIDQDSLVAVFGGPTKGVQWQCDVCASFNDREDTVCPICDNPPLLPIQSDDGDGDDQEEVEELEEGSNNNNEKKKEKRKEKSKGKKREKAKEKNKEKGKQDDDGEASNQGRRMLQPKTSSPIEIQWRVNSGTRQILTGDVEALLKLIKPSDANCMIAVTMEDLYPQESWNFVFGEADQAAHVGVFSFARYSPYFFSKKDKTTLSASKYALLLRRSCQVMVHEVIHLFGVEHCIYYQCCMNGSNNLKESDSQPLYLCPVEIHKLAAFQASVLKNFAFDIEERYRNLLQFYRRNEGFAADAEFAQRVVDRFFPTPSMTDESEDKEKGKENGDGEDEDEAEGVKEDLANMRIQREQQKKEKKAKQEEKEENEKDDKTGGTAIRVTVAPKGNAAKKKMVIVSSMEELKDLAAQKLNLTGKKRKTMNIFSPQGEMITSFKQIREDDTVYVG